MRRQNNPSWRFGVLVRRAGRILYTAMSVLALLAVAMFGLLTFMAVPAPTAETAVEVSGIVVSIERPDENGDLPLVLDGGRRYYVNRVEDVPYFAWDRLLAEVRPGDTVYLTVVTPLAWRLLGLPKMYSEPVGGVQTATTVYMDPAISAATWTTQEQASRNLIIALAIFGVCMLPTLIDRFRRRPPAAPISV